MRVCAWMCVDDHRTDSHIQTKEKKIKAAAGFFFQMFYRNCLLSEFAQGHNNKNQSAWEKSQQFIKE